MTSSLSPWLYRPERDCVEYLIRELDWDAAAAARASHAAAELIESIRSMPRKTGSLESFFQQYGLNTREGLALMALAEALLRIPDPRTATELIRDKVAATQWLQKKSADSDWLMQAAGLGLSLTGATMNSLFSKMGEPVIRQAIGQAIRMLGKQFVLGESVEAALKEGAKQEALGYRLSYDVLGEGARTEEDAQRYFAAYEAALNAIGRAGTGRDKPPGLSVKLSALNPRYSFAQADRCVPDLTEKLVFLCRKAAGYNIALTVDAEECDRLEISLQIIEGARRDPSLRGWEGFGLAVQAYQKRAHAQVERIIELAQQAGRMQVRLVKGAYWDTEVKRAQVLGLPDYPVFTRKVNTDLSYMACAQKLLQHRDRIYPMFGTHNAHTVCAIAQLAGGDEGFEFQRLQGMGSALYGRVLEEGRIGVSLYAPIGPYEDLLPYLVRRLLENGANSSFVNKIYDPAQDVETLAQDPVARARTLEPKRHPQIPLPSDIYGAGRKNAAGVDLTDEAALQDLLRDMRPGKAAYEAAPLIAGRVLPKGASQDILNPAHTGDRVGTVYMADEGQIESAFAAAKTGWTMWSATPSALRAQALEKIADLFEANRAELMALCVREAGKTIPDALAEVREAVDFCRYYALRGREDFAETGALLTGPTGERNVYRLHSRGVFVCISPWNFPLAIFTGQVVAALMAGNAVVAKPAEQTPLIAFRAAQLMHQAGIPREALSLLPGDGRVGAAIVQHPDVAGVAFTGSTEAAKSIHVALAAKEGPIAALIAETGGQNALIADSSALTEQLVDDTVLSAFGSTGQRCSAARVLFVQEDAAEKTLRMLEGAMAQLRLGDPREISTDIGPVIDEEALAALQRHKSSLEGFGRKIAQAPLDESLRQKGHFFAPIAYEINDLSELKKEVFGPVLHVIRYRAGHIDRVIESINATGYGLTLGVHSRIEKFAQHVAASVRAGNVYINRSMIGAVVGVQPFGGQGLSGTGPKAGGPHYLHAFATEKLVSTDTTRAGGNASLVMLGE